MKKLLLLIFICSSFFAKSQTASNLLSGLAIERDTFPPNYVYVDILHGVPMRFYLATWNKLRLNTTNIRNFSDSVNSMAIVHGFVKAPVITTMYDSLNVRQRKFTGTTSQCVLGDGSLDTRITNNNQLINGNGYISGITTGNVIDALGFIPYNSSNPSNYIGAASTDVLTHKSGNISMWANDVGYLTAIPAQSFSSLTGRPTTFTGYGITDVYPLTGNPSNFLTVESDPNVPSYSKSLTGFSVIKAGTDPLYRPITYVPSSAEIATSLGYTAIPSTRTFTINGITQDLSANRTFNVGTVTSIGITSTDFTISSSPITTSGSIVANLNTSGVTAGTYEFITVNNKGIVTGGYNSVTNILSTRTSGTAYQATSTSRIYDLDFTISISIGAGLISASDGSVVLEISPNGSTGWVEYTRSRNANGGVVAAQNSQVTYIEATNIPAGYYYRLVFTQNTGTASWTYINGHETLRR